MPNSISQLQENVNSPQAQISADTQTLLSMLWRDGAYAYFWSPDGPPYYSKTQQKQVATSNVSLWFPLNYIPAVPVSWALRNVYFGVHPTSAPKESWRRATIPSISVINCVFAEFDPEDYGSKPNILTHLATLPLAPTSTVDSGGGYHCYWVFDASIVVTSENLPTLCRIQAAWVDLVGGDLGAKDLARVLRLPGFQNRKPKYAPDYPTVRFVELAPERLYTYDEITALVIDRLIVANQNAQNQIDINASRVGAAPGAAAVLLNAAIRLGQTGSRHNLALWLAHKLHEEGIVRPAALGNLREFARAVSVPGTRKLEEDEMKRIIAFVWKD